MHCATSLDHHVLGFAVPDTISTNMDSWIQDVVCDYLLLLYFPYVYIYQLAWQKRKSVRFMVTLLRFNATATYQSSNSVCHRSLITPPQILITSVLKPFNRAHKHCTEYRDAIYLPKLNYMSVGVRTTLLART